MAFDHSKVINTNVPEKLASVFDKLGAVNLLHNQIEMNPQAIVITSTEGKIIYANHKMSEITGYEQDELIGQNPSLFKSGEQPASFYDRLWNNIRNGENFESRFKNKKKNGELYWAYSQISPLHNDQNDIVGFVSIQEDITNLVKFETESVGNETVLLNLTKSLPNTGVIVLNVTAEEILQAEGEIIQEFFPDKRPNFADLVKVFKAYGFNVKSEISKFCSHGTGRRKKVQADNRTIDINISPVRFAKSDKMYCLMVIRDVTYYQKIIEQVQHSEKQLEAIFQNAGVGIAILDLNGNYLRTNDGWAELIGYSKAEILKSSVKSFIHPDDKEETISQLKKVFKGVSDSLRLEARAIKKDNSVIWGDVSITSIKGKNGKVNAIIAVFVDVTDNKIYREALERSEKQFRELNATKDKFFSIISHDLKNPFSNIIGLTELAIDDPDDKTKEDLMKYIKTVNASANQAYSLLENLLDWSRSQTGAISPVLVHHDLYDLVENSIEYVFNMAKSKRIEIVSDMSPDQWVVCDYDMMHTVLRNLLTNAIKFSDFDSKINVKVEKEAKNTILKVQDYGVGMSEVDKQKIFDVTRNFSNPGTNNEKGTGLGLILVKDFVKLNGGDLSFESTLGKGTTFIIKMPNVLI